MDYVELNNLFCDAEEAYSDKQYRRALELFSYVLEKSIASIDSDPEMPSLAIDAYDYIGVLHSLADDYIWEECSELINRYRHRIETLEQKPKDGASAF
ncbi:MAG: hypothetical protein UH625_10345 [Muribaculaceae bacterium]|nr:hypothetical protein [Muribaculaceae bacterium]